MEKAGMREESVRRHFPHSGSMQLPAILNTARKCKYISTRTLVKVGNKRFIM
jgi:hypothetical protein